MIRLSLSFIKQYLISFEICPERLGVGKVTEKIKLRAKGIFQVGIDTAQKLVISPSMRRSTSLFSVALPRAYEPKR